MVRRRIVPTGAVALAALVVVVAVSAAAVLIEPGSSTPRGTGAFLQKLPKTPRLAKGSSTMVQASIAPYAHNANLANSNDWGVPVAVAQSSDPVRRVSPFPWAPAGQRGTIRFRIPDSARPSAGSDHHLTVIDGDRQLDLWVAERQRDGNFKAGAWAVMDRGADVAGRVAATASGFSLTAGLVRPQEIAAGRIEHALLLTTPYVRNRHVRPALTGDGRTGDPRALPMGSRLQLDPRADISRLPRTQRIIAQALKDYGAYVGDSSGSLSIRAEAGLAPAARASGVEDLWAAVGAANPSLSAIPWSRLRVVAPKGAVRP